MVIYGHRATHLKTEQISDKCPNCGQQSLIMGVFEKYAHIFWITIFPYGKTGTSQCQHCQQVLSDKEFTTELKETYKELKASAKTPI